ncbi:MAG: ABC transporter permease, partial [Thermoplasmata archaeon]
MAEDGEASGGRTRIGQAGDGPGMTERDSKRTRFFTVHRRVFVGLVSLASFVIVWELSSPLINPLLFTWPSQILAAFARAVSTGELQRNFLVSLTEMTFGFVLALVVGIPIGVLMGRSRIVEYVLDPFVTLLYSTPRVSFLPLLVLWFGLGLMSKATLVFLGAMIPILVTTLSAVRNVDGILVDVGRSFGATRVQLLYKVILPASLPSIVAGLRLAVGRSLILTVVAELFASSAGLGFMLINAAALYQIDKVFVAVAVLAAMGVGLTESFKFLARRVAPWTSLADRREKGGGVSSE